MLMPEKSRDFLEAECLDVARRQLGCKELQAVRIGPNWEVLGFTPELPPRAHEAAMTAIAPLRGTYALAKRKT
jgi:hypothetical protein